MFSPFDLQSIIKTVFAFKQTPQQKLPNTSRDWGAKSPTSDAGLKMQNAFLWHKAKLALKMKPAVENELFRRYRLFIHFTTRPRTSIRRTINAKPRAILFDITAKTW